MASKNTPICMLVIILIICNLITLHFLNKSVHRTSSMCTNTDLNDRNLNAHTFNDIPNKHNFPNLLEKNSPYSHLPYLPHNLKNYVNQNPNNMNDPNFIEAIKEASTQTQQTQEIKHTLETHQYVDGISNDLEKYQISLKLLRPKKSITIQDEINRNSIITNDKLWNDKPINANDKEEIICDDTMEYLFNNTIHKLHKLKGRNYMESMICPSQAKLGWRHSSYVPYIFGNHCEPWWARDVVFIASKLINKNMIGIEWGAGISSIWLAVLSNFTIAMEHDKVWQRGVNNITRKLNINNLLVLQENLGRRYCELDRANAFEGNPGGHKWEKQKIDFFSLDGRLRYPSTEWMLSWIKPHGGILIFDNSDRIEEKNKGDTVYGQYNATNLIPKHWLRYDSSYFKQHVQPIKDKRWLQNSMTTIWITRHKKCAKGSQKIYSDISGNEVNNEAELNFKPF